MKDTDRIQRRLAQVQDGPRRQQVSSRLGVLFAILLLQVLVAWTYVEYVSPLYGYMGFVSRSVSLPHVAVSIAIGSIPVIWLPLRPNTPSQLLLWVLQILVVCSSCALGPLLPHRGVWETIGWALWNVACMAAVSLVLVLPTMNLTSLHMSAKTGRRVFYGSFLFVFGFLFTKFGWPNPDIALSTAQFRRLEFRVSLEGGGMIAGYLVVWLQTLFAPMAIMSGLCRRRPVFALVGCTAVLWVYMLQGTRTSLIVIPLGLVFWLALSRGASALVYVWGAIALLALSLGTYVATNSLMVLNLVAKRIFVVPGALGAIYFDFFAGGEPALYRDSFGSVLSESPYPMEIPSMIGATYLGSAETNANVNVFADAFAQLWLAGLLLPVVLALVFWLLDSVTKRLHIPAVVGSLSLLSLALVNTGSTNWLATSGMAVALGIYWLAGPGLFPVSVDEPNDRRGKAIPIRKTWPSMVDP